MGQLPVIVGFGGFNAAGRSSGHIAYQRMIFESLSAAKKQETLQALHGLMHASPDTAVPDAESILRGTLVRRIESSCISPANTRTSRSISVEVGENPVRFRISARELPETLPKGWKVLERAGSKVLVEVSETFAAHIGAPQKMPVNSAGQLPTGFDPGAYYRSVNHPRGLKMTVLGASDAVNSVGIEWEDIVAKVRPDDIAVYSASVMSQLDECGLGGMMQARSLGRRVTSKQLPLGLGSMPADFINAYVLGSVGVTGSISGACATFLYNLRAGVEDIKAGRKRVVMVGSAEAPILPEVIDGYTAMSALGTDEELRKLDGSEFPDHRRASRPFGHNCGFTLAESSQFAILMDDALALELAAPILASVPGVYVHADGFKKSISAPGPGNYLTMASALALARNLVGEDAVRTQSFVHAHGSSTPHNRVSESEILNRIAGTFGITRWPVAAIKSYVGHSLAAAAGDQLGAALGTFQQGILPGIKTIDAVADDVVTERLSISPKDSDLADGAAIGFLNSKGFGGNNATASVFAPTITRELLTKRYGKKALADYDLRHEPVRSQLESYQQAASHGDLRPRYHFGKDMIDERDLALSPEEIRIPGMEHAIQLGALNGLEAYLSNTDG